MITKCHCGNSKSCIFLKSPHQIDVKNITYQTVNIFCGISSLHKHTVNREIDNPKLESSKFQDHLFNPTAGALNFSPDFDKLMYHERLKTRTAQVENCRSKLFGINKDSSTVC